MEDMQKLVDSHQGKRRTYKPDPCAPAPRVAMKSSPGTALSCSAAAGLDKIKVQVRDVDDDQAIIDMVDANIQREHISRWKGTSVCYELRGGKTSGQTY